MPEVLPIALDRATVTETDRPTVLVGLIGQGIQKSRTPAMHEAEGLHHGLRYIYRLFDTDRMGEPRPALADILRSAELCGFTGLNVTFPYKVEVMALMDELSDAARAVGAVNTVVLRNGRRIGDNTDWWGFAESLRQGLPDVPRNRVLLIGAGGAGGAVAQALMDSGVAHLEIFDTIAERASDLVERLLARNPTVQSVTALESLDHLPARAAAYPLDGVVNATPIGMAKLPGTPLPKPVLKTGPWVADVVYFPLETELLRDARAAGCRVLPGSGMAVFQAVKAFELFTGQAPDAGRMAETFNALSDPRERGA
ncbi:MAG: shikimate dehydrogenase [Rhodospirillum sp.]|nr:shikimate dehydrogenase [Rhodospirillum sp.]MCF8490646.1 shikimate dehydrogenase [Rhodospirillum sp.]MCF8500724.1 shikimate dehydrogenase [Rhodospirillum sp.]